MGENAVFDARLFVQRFLGDEETARFIAAAFLEDTPRQIGELARAIQHSDPSAAKFAAHSIKGSAGLIGGQDLTEIARQLESLGAAGDFHAAARLLHELQIRFDMLELGLAQFCRQKP